MPILVPTSVDVFGQDKKDFAEQDSNKQTSSQHVIGLIYPPPEVRNIVDKTANFVARNGPEFESRIRQNELGNPKFNFLTVGDPYNTYYQHKVKEFRENRVQESSQPAGLAKPLNALTLGAPAKQQQLEILKSSLKGLQETPLELKDPPPPFEYIADPPSISGLDLDIVKLTAQFSARNGRNFLTNLMSKEQRNFHFDFLRPQHSLFSYFTKLLEQYTKILVPSKHLIQKLDADSSDMYSIMEQVKYRAEWLKQEEAQKRKEEQVVERERIAYAQIDWHDFVVVETVDYQVGEIGNFPSPTTPDEVGQRALMQERGELGEQEGSDVDEEETGSGDEEKEEEEESDEGMEMDSDDEMLDLTNVKKIPTTTASKSNTQVEDMEEESTSEEEEEEEERVEKGVESASDEAPSPPPPTQPPPPPSARYAVNSAPPLPPQPDKVIVKKGYDPKLAAKLSKLSANEDMISPLTGTKIPADKVQEHMRIGLLDPRWVEQRDKHIHEKMNQESVYAPGTAIEASLKQLAERRTDIFGVGDEETAIGKKIGEEDERKDDKVMWDGHTSSVEAATRAARANITIEDQIQQIHRVQGLVMDGEKEKIGPKPDTLQNRMTQPKPPPPKPKAMPQPPLPPMPVPPARVMPPPPQPPKMIPGPPQPPMVAFGMAQPRPPQLQMMMGPPGGASAFPPLPSGFVGGPAFGSTPPVPQQSSLPPPPTRAKHQMMDKSEDAGAPKKLRTEDALVPEDQFLATNPRVVTFKIAVPYMPDKNEWNLNGQVMEISLHLSESVAALKAKLSEMTSMPPGKQKINFEGLFLKDFNTLAYYNVSTGSTLHLQLKERGGRKK